MLERVCASNSQNEQLVLCTSAYCALPPAPFGQVRASLELRVTLPALSMVPRCFYMYHRTWLLFTCPAANLASRHTPETVTPSLGRDCAFARRQKWLLAKQQRMMILGDFLPSVPPPRLRKDVRRAALQYGKYTMSDLMLVLAYREVATAAALHPGCDLLCR